MGRIDFDKAGFGTRAIHAGQEPDKLYGALATPIYQTSTFCFETVEKGMSVFKGETPGFAYSRSGNPTKATMTLTDIEAVSELAHKHNIRVVVDNTFAPPPVQFPLKLGADLSLHSVTKYLNGYGDVIGGAIVGRAEDIRLISTTAVTKLCGSSVSPFNAFLTLRGLQTLELRMARHCENALAVAKYLEGNPHVKAVYYPGLENTSWTRRGSTGARPRRNYRK